MINMYSKYLDVIEADRAREARNYSFNDDRKYLNSSFFTVMKRKSPNTISYKQRVMPAGGWKALPIVPASLLAKRRRLNSTNQQALRTGGWANPSKGGELKFVDTSVTLVPVAGSNAFIAPGSSNLINGLVPGSSATSRIGRKVNIKSVYVRYSLILNAASLGGSPLRILCVYDKQANSTAPLISDILLLDQFTSPNNLSNRDRFVTIFDEITPCISAGDQHSQAGNLYKNVNLETMFNAGAAGTIGDITSGSIYIIAAQTAGITVQPATIFCQCRVRYTDV